MNQIKCITFDRAVQDALPEHIKAKMKADRQKAKREAYKKLCYNFEYQFGSNIPHCAKRGECDEDCEYMRNFKE
jgi:hypothetical protein